MSKGLIFGMKLPTGTYTAPGFDRDTQPGTGSTNLLLGNYLQGQEKHWGWFAQGIYRNAMNTMTAEIFIATTDEEIESCFPVFSFLRPHLNKGDFLPQVRRQQAQGYRILALKDDDEVKSVAGFRLAEFLAWGKVIYIDDLSTLPTERSQGFAGSLLDWLVDHAKSSGCRGIHLDTGYARHAAHRLYLRKGLQLNCHHLALEF